MLVFARRWAPGQHAPQDPRLPAPAPAGLLLGAQRPPLPAAAAASRSQAGRGEALTVSGPWPARCPQPLGSWGPDALRGSEGSGWQERDLGLGHIVLQGNPAWAPLSGAGDGGGWSLRFPPLLGHHGASLAYRKHNPCRALPHRGQVKKDSPLYGWKSRAQRGQGTCAEPHSILWNLHITGCPPALIKPPERIWASPLGKG